MSIVELVVVYRKAAAEVKRLEEHMDNLKAELRPLLEATDGKWQDGEGYARIVVRDPSVSYDVKALEVLRTSSDQLNNLLGQYRKEKAGSSYVQVK